MCSVLCIYVCIVCLCVRTCVRAHTCVGIATNVVYYRMRNEEIQSLSGVDEFGEFYRRLKQLKDYHRKFADDVSYNILLCYDIILPHSLKNQCPWSSVRWMRREIIQGMKLKV